MPEVAVSGAGQNKPSAAVTVKSEAEPTPQEQPASSNPQGNLTFYKAVQQSGEGTESPTKETRTTVADKTPTTPKPSSPSTTTKTTIPASMPAIATPQEARSAPVTGPGTIVVQIAAVSREDDAVALAGALRKKNYNVFVVNNPITNDKLYHVQVGPFASMQDAEAMKLKLTGEGYNPIVKR